MLRLTHASIRGVLLLVFGSTTVLLLSLVTLDLVHSVRMRSDSLRVAALTVTSKELFRSMVALRVERGGMIGGLSGELPLSAEARAAMLVQRGISEAAYAASLRQLAALDIPELAGTIDDLRNAHQEVAVLRAKIDEAIMQPKNARDRSLLQAGPRDVPPMLNAILAVAAPLEELLKLHDARVDQLLAVKQAAWTARSNLGDISALMLGVASANRALTPAEMLTWQRDRAIGRGAWRIVAAAAARTDAPPALVASVKEANPAFEGIYDDEQESVFANLSQGRDAGMPFADLYRRTRGKDLAEHVLNVAMDEMVAQAEANAQRAEHVMIVAISLLASGLILSVTGFMVMRFRILKPIFDVTEAIHQLAEQNFAVDVPLSTRNDEIGRMQAALLRLKENGRAQQIAVASANEALINLASLDGLTGLYNRRRLDELIDAEWRRCSRERVPISLLMIDVDYFKRFNDHYGHLAGDECLRQVAAELKKAATRATDVAARYGGEEFILLLPATDATAAADIAHKLVTNLRRLAIPHAASPFGRVTLSVGIASIAADHFGEMKQLLAEADRGVYRAKADGRDQVCWSTEQAEVGGEPVLLS